MYFNLMYRTVGLKRMCTMSVLGTHGSQRRAINLIGVDLYMVVSHHVSAGNLTQVLLKPPLQP